MKIKDLIDSYDAMTPTQEKKEKMLSEILNAEDRKSVGYFNFKRAGLAVAGLAAAIALVVSVYSFVDIGAPNNGGTYVAQVTDSNKDEKQSVSKTDENYVPKTEKKAERKKPAEKKRTEVAVAKPDKISETADAVVEATPQPRSSGGGSGGAMGRSITQNVEDELNDNSGIAMASEEIYSESPDTEAIPEDSKGDSGIAIASEKDIENEVEWITVPSMEGVPELEENSGIEGSAEEDEDEEDEEDTE